MGVACGFGQNPLHYAFAQFPGSLVMFLHNLNDAADLDVFSLSSISFVHILLLWADWLIQVVLLQYNSRAPVNEVIWTILDKKERIKMGSFTALPSGNPAERFHMDSCERPKG